MARRLDVAYGRAYAARNASVTDWATRRFYRVFHRGYIRVPVDAGDFSLSIASDRTC